MVATVDRELLTARQQIVRVESIAVGHLLKLVRAGGNPHRGFARRRATAAAIVAKTVFLRITVVSMARAKQIHDLAVILRALILVIYQQANRRAGGAALENTRQNLHRIVLAPLGRVARSSRLTPVEVLLQVGFAEFETGRATVDDTADCAAMTLAKRSHHE